MNDPRLNDSFWMSLKEDDPTPSPWALWWHSLDSVLLVSFLILIGLGVWLILAASPAVATHHNWSTFVLIKRHLFLMGPGIVLLLGCSCLTQRQMLRTALMGGVLIWVALWIVLWMGIEVKGARRWLSFQGFSLQPSEFLKPAMIIVTAKILSTPYFPIPKNFMVVLVLTLAAVIPLLLQPDIGMMVLVTAVTFIQCFVAGLPWLWVGGSAGLAGLGAISIYLCFPHTVHRIQSFLGGGASDPFGSQYQTLQALKGFAAGGFWGGGPGTGTVLDHLPDSHADFIFAVAGEEMGLLACLLILSCYALVIFRSLWKVFQESDSFYALAIVGLSAQLALQVFLNVGSVLHLIPTKGMTLPFISYGGSSFLSLCWGMGMLLALTRRYRGV